jgi:Amt family ammonium transporter
MNTFLAAAAAGLAWALVEWAARRALRPTWALASGVVAGLVAITPAAVGTCRDDVGGWLHRH